MGVTVYPPWLQLVMVWVVGLVVQVGPPFRLPGQVKLMVVAMAAGAMANAAAAVSKAIENLIMQPPCGPSRAIGYECKTMPDDLALRKAMNAKPSRPVPSRSRDAGSGVSETDIVPG